MLEGLADGTIEVISTDHAPHSAKEKALPLAEAPMGIVGLETAVGLTLTYLVESGALPLIEAIARWTCHPARILRLPGGKIAAGELGDLTLLDLEREWTVDPMRFRSKSHNTPFAAYRCKGKAVATIVGGRIVYMEA
jgi:dihydroorotase